MIIALKLLIVVVWVGAGVSKLGLHFTNVIPPMVSNSPFDSVQVAEAGALPRTSRDDLRPSHLAIVHGARPGSVVEILAPLILLFSTNKWVTLVAAADHGGLPPVHHLDVPARGAAGMERAVRLRDHLPVPGLPGWNGYAPWDMSSPWLTVDRRRRRCCSTRCWATSRPDKVSFLPSMRQYAGNWASAVWAFAPGAEAKLNKVTRSAKNQVDQFVEFGYEPKWADVTMQTGDLRGAPCTARAAACSRCC